MNVSGILNGDTLLAQGSRRKWGLGGERSKLKRQKVNEKAGKKKHS